MKQFNIEIDDALPKVNRFTQETGQRFSLLVDYGGWTANKAYANMLLFDQDGNQVTEKIVPLAETRILHICAPVSKDTTLSLKIPSAPAVRVPVDVVQLAAVRPSVECNEFSYRESILSPSIGEASVSGPVEVLLDRAYAPFNKLDVKMGQGNVKPELKVADKDGNAILDIQAWREKKMGQATFYENGRQIHMNADKLTLNGVELALKEVTFGETTLSVLAAVET